MPSPSPMTRWALTPPFHPHRLETGSLFSVALSRGSPRVGVTHHPALWSPDFPRQLSAAAITRMARPGANSTDISVLPPHGATEASDGLSSTHQDAIAFLASHHFIVTSCLVSAQVSGIGGNAASLAYPVHQLCAPHTGALAQQFV